MPKQLPRDQRLTATVSVREKKTAERLVREIDGIENMSDLVRQLLKDRLARHLAEKKVAKTSAASRKLAGSKAVAPVKPARKRRSGQRTTRRTDSSATQNAPQ